MSAAPRFTVGALAALVVAIQPQSVRGSDPGHAQARASNAPRISTRWAGYVASGGDGAFTAVQGTWVQPAIRCDRPNSSAAFWIGLGGAMPAASGLEQIGTSADCSESLLPSYSAWYELIPVPAAPVDVPVLIAPGDRVAARVGVSGASVEVSLHNLTTGRSFTARIIDSSVDVSSAEWVAEAPSFCLTECTPLPLPDFGTVRFTRATASDRAHSAPIGDAGWTHRSIVLVSAREQPTAVPSHLSPDGSRFSVRWKSRR